MAKCTVLLRKVLTFRAVCWMWLVLKVSTRSCPYLQAVLMLPMHSCSVAGLRKRSWVILDIAGCRGKRYSG